MQRLWITTSPTCKSSAKLLVCLLSIFLRLKKQYCATNEQIGKTSAGLKAEDVMPGSKIANIISMYYIL